MKISTILDQVDLGSIALPKFQRGYVWNRDQVRSLMKSLYHKHPVGSLLVWVTKTEGADTRGDGHLAPGSIKILLDGQQRITSLYGIIRGKAPQFFEGNEQAFTGLYFNLDDEVFEFYAPVKMKDNPLWINITDLMQMGAGAAIGQLYSIPELNPNIQEYINRLNRIDNIKEIDLHIEEVTGEDKTVDVVVDIFNMVNSGGTKLSKGDLALAKICAEWPEVREEMQIRLHKWNRAGFSFRLEWLLRCINSVTTGESYFSALKDIDIGTFRNGLSKTEKLIDMLLNMISARLGLDHDRVLGSRGSFPLMARYLATQDGHVAGHLEQDKLLYWYIHTMLWGRYASSTEGILKRDLTFIAEDSDSLQELIEDLRKDRGDLRLYANDFGGWSKAARFYPMLYMMTRVCHSKDFNTGIELSNHMLGNLSSLEVHHIFPKAKLYKLGFPKSEVNAIANFTFLTKETNLLVTDRNPEEYLAEYSTRNPGVLESHWIPTNRELWKYENYLEFLNTRRELLAKAANEFLDSLFAGTVTEAPPSPSILERKEAPLPGGVESEIEEKVILEFDQWVIRNGLPPGEYMYELTDMNTSEPLAILDLAWPDGLQEELSQPVALLIDEGKETEEAANRAGYRYFTTVDEFKDYVKREILAIETEYTLV
ncbi:MAG: DUF262 domain-containing protein [Planctomycetes bacterium]|nr:DUF262 domain-containing protein [Planctomycetota bacterium]